MFDARSAKALKPGEHLTVPDAPGLRLEATQQHRTWTYRYKSPVDGRMRQVRLGRWPALAFAGALAAWERLKQQRDAGADPAAEKRAKRAAAVQASSASAYTVAHLVADYLRDYQSAVAPKTYAEAARLLNRELTALEHKPAAQVTRADAFDLLNGMQQRPVVAGMLRQQLGAAWDRALDAGRLAPDVPNWWRLVLRGKLKSKGKVVDGEHQGVVKRALSAEELALLLPWLPNFTRDVEDALRLVLWTACRGAEVVAMQREEVCEEPDGWWWTVPKGKLKMRRNPLLTDLRVPLVGVSEQIVRRRLESTAGAAGGWVFPSRGASGHIEQKALGVAVWTHMPGCALRKDWIRPRLPVANWAPHDLRRTARTQLAALGCPAEVAEAILGHLLPGMQGTYNRHHYDVERRTWLTRLAAHLDQLGGQGRAPTG